MEMGDDEQWRLAIDWPPLSIRVVCENNMDNNEHTSDDREDKSDDDNGKGPADAEVPFVLGADDALAT